MKDVLANRMQHSAVAEKEKPGKPNAFRKRLGWLLLVLGSFVSGLAMMGLLLFWPAANKPAAERASPFAVTPAPALPSDKSEITAPEPPPPEPASGPMLAVVVGDLGYDPVRDADWLNVPAQVTLAILPFGPSSSTIASSAQDRGHCVILHVPMEPRSAVTDDTAPHFLRVGMDRDEITGRFSRMAKEIPQAVGAMNHMGSAFTTNAESMDFFAEALKEKRFFFVDGLTAPGSFGVSASQKAGILSVRRDVFFDDDPSPSAMRRRWSEAVTLAKKKGSAVLVCRGSRESFDALSSLLPRLKEEGIRPVAVTELLDKLQSADGFARKEQDAANP